jgi:hypothetical protein
MSLPETKLPALSAKEAGSQNHNEGETMTTLLCALASVRQPGAVTIVELIGAVMP